MLASILKAIPAVPEFILAIGALLSLMAGLFKSKRIVFLTFCTIFASLLFLCALLAFSAKSDQFFWHGLFIHTPFLDYAKIILYSVSALTFFCLYSFLEEYHIKEYEWLIVTAFAVIGGSVALSSNHFLTFFIGLELSHLSQYLLVSANRDNSKSSEAAIKFFTIGAISTALMLFGISLIYGFTGTNDFNSLYSFFDTHIYDFHHSGAIIGMFFVLISLFFKLPAAPFHSWAPDVYQSSPLPILVFIGTVPKIITTFCILHLVTYPFYGIFTYWRYLFVGMAVLSMIWGPLAALRQTNLKRMLAYSAIGNIGFLLMATAMGSELGIESTIVYAIIYTINMTGTLTLMAIFEKRFKPIDNIADLSGIMQQNPMIGTIFCLLILSLAGVPPLPGFFAKAYILLAVTNRSAYILAIIAVITTVISTAYYLNILKHFMLNQTSVKLTPISYSKKYLLKTVITLTFLATFLCVIFPGIILEPCRSMAASVLFNK
jgi:NADH-quinone oxidoreductase subunit N